MIRSLTLVLVYISINVGFIANQQTENSNWELSKSENEISIYLRSVTYSNYKEFKGEMIVRSKPKEIVAFLQHIDSFKEWLPDCLESKKLFQNGENEQMNYILTDVPWPYEDRDIVYQFNVIDRNTNLDQIKILLENKPEYIPSKKNIVRIPRSVGFWTITKINEDYTKMEYQMHVEPGGFVPAWLANFKIVDTPYTFLYNLREQIEKNNSF